MLAKHIHHELLPTLDEDDEGFFSVASALPLSTVEEEIKSIVTRNNYGVEVPSGAKLPAALCVWRWEVRPQHMDWLPKNSREKVEARLAERIQVRPSHNLILLHSSYTNAGKGPHKSIARSDAGGGAKYYPWSQKDGQ